MLVEVYFNDAAGGSFSPESSHYEASAERRELAVGRMGYLPMCDGYDRERAVLVESQLSPLLYALESDPLAACERAFAQLNAEFRPNGRFERSLSVGDVIRIGQEWFACANVGWERVEEPVAIFGREA